MSKLSYGTSPELSINKAKIVILPVPYDKTSTWIKGSDKGPKAILEASKVLENYDIETDSQAFKKGIFTEDEIIEKGLPEKMVDKVKNKVLSLIDDKKFVVTIGGEHSVAIGSMQAHAERYKDITILQLDAHADLQQEYHGSKYNHGCVMARVNDLCNIVQIGIRSMDTKEKKEMNKENVFFAKDIVKDAKWTDKVVSKLSKNVYITIDADVFDPSIMPSTGTPEPGGLGWYEVLRLLKKVIAKKNLVGFDFVELCPKKENKAPDFMAAKLIYKVLSYKF